MSAHEEDAGLRCDKCGVTFDVHLYIAQDCEENRFVSLSQIKRLVVQRKAQKERK